MRARMRFLRCLWAVIVGSPHGLKAATPRATAAQMRSQSKLPAGALEDTIPFTLAYAGQRGYPVKGSGESALAVARL
jgi:hypothetical protein